MHLLIWQRLPLSDKDDFGWVLFICVKAIVAEHARETEVFVYSRPMDTRVGEAEVLPFLVGGSC